MQTQEYAKEKKRVEIRERCSVFLRKNTEHLHCCLTSLSENNPAIYKDMIVIALRITDALCTPQAAIKLLTPYFLVFGFTHGVWVWSADDKVSKLFLGPIFRNQLS